MLYWLSTYSVLLFRCAFVLGMVCAGTAGALLKVSWISVAATGIGLCVAVIALAAIARIVSWLSRQSANPSSVNEPWDRLSADQFRELRFARAVDFVTRLMALLATAVALGWMSVAMTLVLLGEPR